MSRTPGRPTMDALQAEQINPTLTPEDTDLIELVRGTVRGRATVLAVKTTANTGPTGATGATGVTGSTGSTGATGSSGGSREVDLGLVSAVDCATLGPQTLLSLASGEIAYGSKVYSGNVNVDNPAQMLIGSLGDIVGAGEAVLVTVDDSSVSAAYAEAGVTNFSSDTPRNGLISGPVDIVSAWQTATTGFIVDTAPVAWQALHAFTDGQFHIDTNGHIQHVTVAGTSGSSQPTWDDSGSDTTDGGVTWTDEGLAPTVGEGRFSVTVTSLVQP